MVGCVDGWSKSTEPRVVLVPAGMPPIEHDSIGTVSHTTLIDDKRNKDNVPVKVVVVSWSGIGLGLGVGLGLGFRVRV